MSNELILSKVSALLEEILAQEPLYFLVDAKIKPTNNIKVYIDGDEGITIEKCIQINRSLRAKIDEIALLPEGEYSLEVSSPGIDEPLKMTRQFYKNKGRLLEVTFVDASQKSIVGQLKEVSDMSFCLEIKTGKGKKETIEIKEIAYSDVQKAIVQIQF